MDLSAVTCPTIQRVRASAIRERETRWMELSFSNKDLSAVPRSRETRWMELPLQRHPLSNKKDLSGAPCLMVQRVRSFSIWKRNPSIFRAWLKEHLTPMSLAVTRCRMLLIASMQWILTNELLRRCKELANLTSLYFTGPNQRVSKATTSIFYKHGGSKIQTA